MYRLFMKPLFRKGFLNYFRLLVTLVYNYLAVFVFLLYDLLIFKPDAILINREIFRRVMPGIYKPLYKALLKKHRIIWSFDDYIMNNGEISKREWKLLCEYSDRIMVTHDYLKNTLPEDCRPRAEYIPQSDRDIHFAKKEFEKEKFEKNIRLCWVATGGNLPYLKRVIKDLDRADRKSVV